MMLPSGEAAGSLHAILSRLKERLFASVILCVNVGTFANEPFDDRLMAVFSSIVEWLPAILILIIVLERHSETNKPLCNF